MLSSGYSITIAVRSKQQLWLLAQGLKKKKVNKESGRGDTENRKRREGIEETEEEVGPLRRRT